MFRQKGSTDLPIVFFMADETDHETGLTGLTCAVTLSKNGGAFGAVISFVELADTDLVYEPAGEPPEFDFICEADWKNLCGDQKEADYIKALGLVVSG